MFLLSRYLLFIYIFWAFAYAASEGYFLNQMVAFDTWLHR